MTAMAPARPTMRDVADAAGVGIKTVSRYVNGEPGLRPETAARVLRAIEATGFRRNEVARSMRAGQRSSMLALVLGDLTNPFYAHIARAVVSVAEQHDHAVLVSSSDEDPQLERKILNVLVGRQVDGLLVVPDGSDQSYLLPEIIRGTPMVFLDRPPVGVIGDIVVLDNLDGGRQAVNHLLDHGHRRVAALVASSYYTTGTRLSGYRAAIVERYGADAVDESLVCRLQSGSVDEAEEVTAALLAREDAPTAIFATTGFLSQGAVRAINRAGAATALVGFDDFPMADQLAVPVTVVDGDADALGRQAAELILARLAGDAGPPRRLQLPTQLIARGSGELRPA